MKIRGVCAGRTGELTTAGGDWDPRVPGVARPQRQPVKDPVIEFRDCEIVD